MRKAKFRKPSHHATKPADFKADVQKIADEWRVAFKSKDIDKVASTYTDDAVFINPEGSFHGSGDIKGEFKQMIERGNTTDTITTIKAVQAGDLGYAEGTYTGKAPTQSGPAAQMGGQWVVTLKKVKDKWLLATHTSLPGAKGAAKAKKSA